VVEEVVVQLAVLVQMHLRFGQNTAAT